MGAGDQACTSFGTVSMFHCVKGSRHTSPTAIFGKSRKNFLNGKMQHQSLLCLSSKSKRRQIAYNQLIIHAIVLKYIRK